MTHSYVQMFIYMHAVVQVQYKRYKPYYDYN